MLKGKDLGAAIRQALQLKDASERRAGRQGVRPVDLARHFGVKPPSVNGWFETGSIAKDKLPALWLYFSDVVGPEHWGLKNFPEARVPGQVFDEVTPEDRAFLADFLLLPDDEQEQYRSEIQKRATTLRAYLEKQLQRSQKHDAVPPKEVAPTSDVRSTDEQSSRPADLYGIEDVRDQNNGNGAKDFGGARGPNRRRA